MHTFEQSANSVKKLLLIDDDVELGSLLKEYFSNEGFEFIHALRGKEGLECLDESIDCVLLDVMMPDLDGFEVLRQLRQISLVPVLMLTAKGDDMDKVLGLEMGADDYLPKPYNPRELLARVKALVRRNNYSNSIPSTETVIGDLTLNFSMREAKISGKTLPLTQTEYMILIELTNNANQVVDKRALCQAVLGRRLVTYDRSIDMHMSNLRRKLQKASKMLVIKTVRGAGYALAESEGNNP
ncbi:MAG: response regulator transcription factor [Pseudomonadota bacterium]